MALLKALLRASTANMSTDDAKELSGAVSVIYNDKVKADREKDKGKKKGGSKKKGIQMGKGIEADAFEGALPLLPTFSLAPIHASRRPPPLRLTQATAAAGGEETRTSTSCECGVQCCGATDRATRGAGLPCTGGPRLPCRCVCSSDRRPLGHMGAF